MSQLLQWSGLKFLVGPISYLNIYFHFWNFRGKISENSTPRPSVWKWMIFLHFRAFRLALFKHFGWPFRVFWILTSSLGATFLKDPGFLARRRLLPQELFPLAVMYTKRQRALQQPSPEPLLSKLRFHDAPYFRAVLPVNTWRATVAIKQQQLVYWQYLTSSSVRPALQE